MKKKCLIIFIILMNIITTFSYAHSGRTDSDGGHQDNNNVSGLGSYHYHHGQSAHLHPGGVCPFGTNGNNSVTINSFDEANKIDFVDILFYGTFGYFAISRIVSLYCNIRQKKIEHMEFLEEKERYIALFEGKSTIELAKVPKDIFIDVGDVPIHNDGSNTRWGSQYISYVTRTGSKYHHKRGCSGAQFEMHLFAAINSRSGCSRCVSGHESIPKWYYEYLKIKGIKNKYGIE